MRSRHGLIEPPIREFCPKKDRQPSPSRSGFASRSLIGIACFRCGRCLPTDPRLGLAPFQVVPQGRLQALGSAWRSFFMAITARPFVARAKYRLCDPVSTGAELECRSRLEPIPSSPVSSGPWRRTSAPSDSFRAMRSEIVAPAGLISTRPAAESLVLRNKPFVTMLLLNADERMPRPPRAALTCGRP